MANGDTTWQLGVAERLGRIEEKLDGVAQRLGDGQDIHLNHGNRIGALERWCSYILGALAVITLGLILLFKVVG